MLGVINLNIKKLGSGNNLFVIKLKVGIFFVNKGIVKSICRVNSISNLKKIYSGTLLTKSGSGVLLNKTGSGSVFNKLGSG